MKIFLTGTPGIGKSTILEQVNNSYKGKKFGIISRELKDKLGHRIGFEAVNFQGKRSTFAHINQIKSPFLIGGKYFVDLNILDHFVVSQILRGVNHPQSLVFIDEIGRMQAFSKKFIYAVQKLVHSNSNILATIVSDPEPWSLQFKNDKHLILVQITKSNRTLLPKLIQTIYENSAFFQKLNTKQQELVILTARQYFVDQKYLQLTKLFKNAIPYVVKGKVNSKATGYLVTGNSKQHTVQQQNDKFVCDCDLFTGRGFYLNSNGECSHIQASKIQQAE